MEATKEKTKYEEIKEYNKKLVEKLDKKLLTIKKIFGKKVLIRLFKAYPETESGLIVPGRSELWVDDRTHKVKHKLTKFSDYTYKGVVVGIGDGVKDEGIDIQFGDIVHIAPSVNLEASARSLSKNYAVIDSEFNNYFLINVGHIEWKENQ